MPDEVRFLLYGLIPPLAAAVGVMLFFEGISGPLEPLPFALALIATGAVTCFSIPWALRKTDRRK
jgi:hypothetical protein